MILAQRHVGLNSSDSGNHVEVYDRVVFWPEAYAKDKEHYSCVDE